MATPTRLAILECDTLPPSISENGYCGLYTALLYAGADALSIPHSQLDISKWNVKDEMDKYPSPDDIDAILISGSSTHAYELRTTEETAAADAASNPELNAFDDTEWILRLVEYVKKILKHDRIRVIGVCYGHQIVGRAMGAKVARSDAWEVSVSEVRLTPKGKQVFEKDLLYVHQMHKDIVCQYPEGVEELGWSDKCRVQGMYTPKKVITVQGHPEFTEAIMQELLKTRRAQNIFDEGTYQDAMARSARPHDAVVVAKAFLKFLLEE